MIKLKILMNWMPRPSRSFWQPMTRTHWPSNPLNKILKTSCRTYRRCMTQWCHTWKLATSCWKRRGAGAFGPFVLPKVHQKVSPSRRGRSNVKDFFPESPGHSAASADNVATGRPSAPRMLLQSRLLQQLRTWLKWPTVSLLTKAIVTRCIQNLSPILFLGVALIIVC